MTPTGWIIIVISIIVGVTIGFFISKRFPRLFNKVFGFLNKDKKMEDVLKNPHLLVEKLKSTGKIYDMGKELDIKVGKDNQTDQDVVVVEEIKTKKAKKIQKKITGEAEKKGPKTKKKIKKKYSRILSKASKKEEKKKR